ncbi:T-box transcription factor TBX21 [Amia ocellicauda]|uniref:T-box transcription factor TBX21 n=1 Tax=Amia ocellicauda TaxID=2972642 RepID=UPI003464AB17
MGGIGGSFYLSMLNGTETASFGKDADINNHLHRSKDLPDLKMGIQDNRFYYQDPVQGAPDSCSLALPYPPGQSVAGFGTQPGRFFSPTALSSCPYNAVRSPGRAGGGGQSYTSGGSEGFPPTGKEVYTANGEGYSATFQHGYPRPSLYPLPGLQVCGRTQAVLNNYPLWAKFHKYQTEMIITKQGRRMFPFLSFNITGLEPTAHYNVYVDVILADHHHWRYQGGKWVQCGKAEGNMPGNRMYMHPDSPNSGAHWMRQEVSFGKLKLTNNKGSSNNVAQMIVLQSLHKYQPRLHIVEVKEDGSEDPYLTAKAQSFVFPETQFIAVTAYQNADITQLKIDHNPFAKGFRDNFDTIYAPQETDRLTPSPIDGPQLLSGNCYQPYLPEQYMGTLPQGRFFGRERAGMGHAGHQTHQGLAAHPGQPKEPGSSPHGRWYLPGQQGASANRLEFNSYDSDFSGNGFMSYKPFPIQTAAHHPLGYYPDHPFGPGAVSTAAAAGGWGPSRPSAPYLNAPHPHPHPKSSPSLSWFRPMTSDPRLHHSIVPELQQNPPLPPLPPPPLQDKPKEPGPGEDSWLEPPSVKSVDSADSGLYEGSAESKKRRVSPYASSTESSPPNRSADTCEKDSGSDAGYYGFYTN